MALTLEKLLLLLPYDAKPDQIKALDLADKGIVGLPKQTAFLKALRKLSLAKNKLTDLSPVANIATLTQLDLSHNVTLTSLQPLKALTGLVVLTVSNCSLQSLEGIEGSKGTLKSLVANDNKIILGVGPSSGSGADALAPIVEANRKALMAVSLVIETLVLSRNPNLTGGYVLAEENDAAGQAMSASAKKKQMETADAGKKEDEQKEHIQEDPKNPLHFLGAFEQLRKLSLSECGIKSLPRRWFMPLLTELRLANNDISNFSAGILLKSLKVLDVSNNKLPHWNLVKRCKFLKQLSIKGNPLDRIDTPMPTETTKASWEAEGLAELKKKEAAALADPKNSKGKAGEKKEAPKPRSDSGAGAVDANAPSSALHDNPLEVLYLRAVLPQLEILDGRKFINPPAGSDAAAIQAAISTIHKRDHLARKAKLGTEKEGDGDAAAAAGAKKGGQNTNTKAADSDEEEAQFEAKRAARKSANNVSAKGVRVGDGGDQDDDAVTDPTLLARRRRRQEEEGADDNATSGTSRKRERSPPPPIEDVEYEVPQAIAQKAARNVVSANLIKRERHYAVGESAAASAAAAGGNNKKNANDKSSGSNKQQEQRVVFSSGADALAALRMGQSAAGGW